MSTPPRSQRLLSFNTTIGTASAIFTCPAGYTVLVKSMYVNPVVAAADARSVLVVRSGLAQDATVVELKLTASGALSWDGWFVLNPGDGMYVYQGEGSGKGIVSGAVLQGEPQLTPATTLTLWTTAAPLPKVLG